MFDNEYREQFLELPPAEMVVKELFEKSKEVSLERTFVLLLGVEEIEDNGIKSLMCFEPQKWIVSQFIEYYELDSLLLDENYEEPLIIRQQMLVYSLFWECSWIKQLFYNLLQNIHSQNYNKKSLKVITNRTTANLFEEILKISKEADLKLYQFLKIIYNNQIRNALFHSDIYICKESKYISLENYNSKIETNLPSIHFDTWRDIYLRFKKFVYCMLKEKNNMERQLKEKMPLNVRLPEFEGEIELGKDRGMYYAKPLY